MIDNQYFDNHTIYHKGTRGDKVWTADCLIKKDVEPRFCFPKWYSEFKRELDILISKMKSDKLCETSFCDEYSCISRILYLMTEVNNFRTSRGWSPMVFDVA